MSERAASLLMEDIEFVGPVRTEDVKNARSTVVNVVYRLSDQGRSPWHGYLA